MSPTPKLSPFLPVKITLGVIFGFSLLGMAVGFLLAKTPLFLVGIVIAFFSTASAVRQFGRYLRVAELERKWVAEESGFGDGTHAIGLPEQIFTLLCTVAESDGRAGPRERALIQQFVLARFPDPILAARLARWDVAPLDEPRLVALLRDLRRRLTVFDRVTIFSWCALVALIDERFNEREHAVLQTIAKQLGIDAEQARLLFLDAKARVLNDRAWRGNASWGRGAGHQGHTGPGHAGVSRDRRAAALSVLGLDATADEQQIRRRHRELVKKHHPDAHSHLGPIAQQEATERFRRIQEAYEVLTGAR